MRCPHQLANVLNDREKSSFSKRWLHWKFSLTLGYSWKRLTEIHHVFIDIRFNDIPICYVLHRTSVSMHDFCYRLLISSHSLSIPFRIIHVTFTHTYMYNVYTYKYIYISYFFLALEICIFSAASGHNFPKCASQAEIAAAIMFSRLKSHIYKCKGKKLNRMCV